MALQLRRGMSPVSCDDTHLCPSRPLLCRSRRHSVAVGEGGGEGVGRGVGGRKRGRRAQAGWGGGSERDEGQVGCSRRRISELESCLVGEVGAGADCGWLGGVGITTGWGETEVFMEVSSRRLAFVQIGRAS